MNKENVEGKFDQVAGKIKQSVGEAVGNQHLANSGVADQVKGAAKETWGNAKDTAQTVRDDHAAGARAEGEDVKYRAENSADHARNKITSAAEHVRDSVNEKLDNVRNNHDRS
ncbi:MAG: CsbD family protein [Acidobacteriota bacterium]|nr:CsbD family protein [Acidobacteriota bacterium]